ncbi:MAG: UDP-N-acetylmuramoylalanine--D-glutamate ligase [Candidatus Doudnabacteria bacterium]|nr:UDP-N-acetylmuramoylalanine--D-glutamate ligase [Candidatus Doudnabacteria bacterium]
MTLADLKNKKIAILGFGIEGQAVANYLKKHQIDFDILDKKDDPAYLEKVTQYEILFRSPGVKINEPLLIAAQKKGIEITSQVKFFLENCPAKVIGVTGSKGKGTTSKLIFEILQNAKIKAYLAGNIGIPAIDLLETITEDSYVVLELSSFQLQDLKTSPHIAVVLMVVPEHFDYHLGMEEYIEAKSSITKYQKDSDFAVINVDYEPSVKIGKNGSGQKFYIQTLPAEKVSTDPFNIYKPEEFLKIKNGIFAEQLHGAIYLVEKGQLSQIAETKDSPLRGFHNIENISAALMVSKILNIKDSIVLETIHNYKGLEHRLEFVVEKNKVKFYNDSIGTTPQSALAAIKAFNEPEIVIIGGVDKKVNYREFTEELCRQKNLKALVLIGEIAAGINADLKELGFTGKILTGAQNMTEIFSQLKNIAEAGDVVLLAPGTSSFDMFKDYKDRGNQFKKFAEQYE